MSYKRKLIRQAQREAQRVGGAGTVAAVTVYHDHNCGHWRAGARVMGTYLRQRGR